MTRYKSQAEFNAAVEARAREIWNEREEKMWGRNPHFAKQTWEQASEAARRATIATAKADILARK